MHKYRDDFWYFEQAGWDKAADHYELVWAGLTRPFVPSLLHTARVTRGSQVLDIGCGPGYVSEVAAEIGATPVGIDFSARMIQRAKKRSPGLEFQIADAHELPFEGERFDAVVSNFGLLHLSRPEKALAEICRILRPGGRLAFSLWARPEFNPRARILAEAIQAHGNTKINLPQGPPKFLFTDRDKVAELLSAAGFLNSTVRISTISTEWHIRSAGFWINAERKGSVRTAAVLARQPAPSLERIRMAVRDAIQIYARNDGYAIPSVAHLVVATAFNLEMAVDRSVEELPH